jgi:WS/DGAT C-terminal domain/Wax ester synthase/diacylglycerol acyltransferase catalytic domain
MDPDEPGRGEGVTGAAGSIPLTQQDEAILRLEGQLLVGHTSKVISLASPGPSVHELRARVAQRIAAVPPLAMRLGESGGRPAWVSDPGFDAGEQVVEVAGGSELGPAELRSEIGRLFAERLARERPLWRIDVARLTGGGAALVWRLHHTLADGTTAMRFARALLWDGEPDAGSAAASSAAHAADERRRRAHLARFFAREFARAHSPLDGAIGLTRDVAFASVPLRPLHDAARELAGATLNDALLSAVGGGLREWVERHHGRLGTIRVKVPVSLHHAGEDAANADSFFVVEVPLTEPDPVRRLRLVRDGTALRKADHDAETMDRVLAELRSASPRLSGLCERVERSGRAFALNVSNVPGPRAPVSVLGASVVSMHSIAEIARHHALRVAVVSMCDTLYLGFCADAELVADVGEIAVATEREALATIAAADLPAPPRS